MGRDLQLSLSLSPLKHFNPLSPHGERLSLVKNASKASDISIHSPRMGRDHSIFFILSVVFPFQSTLPAWGETTRLKIDFMRLFYFNPLSPHGERRLYCGNGYTIEIFQSTLPAWGETWVRIPEAQPMPYFNPLSPHGERLIVTIKLRYQLVFQSTLPAWGETGYYKASAF